MNSFKDMFVWQKSLDLSLMIYKLTDGFPKYEIYGLTSQIRRAVVSIPANISEGYSRRNMKEYGQFIRIAYASGAELETELLIAQKREYGEQQVYVQIFELLTEVMKMLYALDKKVSYK